ncbi:hypothetical protein RA274_27450, partial [Pseudomonas syringae pv. tagetis]|uniref:hypothetical protein n=1 Tax=Pseudomonas syringae group genomosp. 7 TaxID=251699 RepID=UPI0037702FAD
MWVGLFGVFVFWGGVWCFVVVCWIGVGLGLGVCVVGWLCWVFVFCGVGWLCWRFGFCWGVVGVFFFVRFALVVEYGVWLVLLVNVLVLVVLVLVVAPLLFRSAEF